MGHESPITLGDYHPHALVSNTDLERASEMISLLDQVDACAAIADQLMLHVCSADMRGRTLNLSSSLQSELSVLAAQAHHLSRRI